MSSVGNFEAHVMTEADHARVAASSRLVELLAMSLIEKGLVDQDQLCTELELLARARREEHAADAEAAALVSLALSLRATRSGQLKHPV